MSVLSLIPEDRKKEFRKESLESVYSSNSRLNLLNKRKRLNPLSEAMSNHTVNGRPDKYVTQRVLSAKTHRVKQLQNQLADAHYHLQELSNENRVLRALQKKQEIALQRYENSNAELPQVLNSHSEEMRVQQTKYKQLKHQYKEVTQKLKEREMQLQQLKDEHQHLLELSKDRNLLEREKLQAQVSDLTLKVNSQNETISMLQRRIALEAKNFRHQLQNEINKHKDTRHDLDLAITNADKLSTIIEMKEKMLSTAASRSVKSPVKSSSMTAMPRPVSKTKPGPDNTRSDERNAEQSFLAKLCENSRNISSSLSHDDTSSSTEPRSAYARSRTNSTSRSTPNHKRKSSKSSSDDNMIELAKTVQDGMADLAIFDDVDFKNSSPDEVQKKIESMKVELLTKIKNNEEPSSRKSSALRRGSLGESIEEQIEEEEVQERPKSRGRRNSNVSFYGDVTVEETTTTVTINSHNEIEHDKKPKRETSNLDRRVGGIESEMVRPKRENSNLEKILAAKPIDKYCKDIIQDIEKSSKVIDRHLKQFNTSQFESDKLVQQLQAVDKINDFVNSNGEIPAEALTELNNNFKMLTDQVFTDVPVPRKRSLSGRRGSRTESRTNLLGDSNLSNQDLLDDLLGKK
ncbi:lebercilin [Amyelois transitella]|uniref:lebercilin n=1 Tax=Amyelois transitella TaxID=680683 RepID=UPI00298F43CD|nr:lebercilin [Amyelois transitella]